MREFLFQHFYNGLHLIYSQFEKRILWQLKLPVYSFLTMELVINLWNIRMLRVQILRVLLIEPQLIIPTPSWCDFLLICQLPNLLLPWSVLVISSCFFFKLFAQNLIFYVPPRRFETRWFHEICVAFCWDRRKISLHFEQMFSCSCFCKLYFDETMSIEEIWI